MFSHMVLYGFDTSPGTSRLLLKWRADSTVVDREGITPLRSAIKLLFGTSCAADLRRLALVLDTVFLAEEAELDRLRHEFFLWEHSGGATRCSDPVRGHHSGRVFFVCVSVAHQSAFGSASGDSPWWEAVRSTFLVNVVHAVCCSRRNIALTC